MHLICVLLKNWATVVDDASVAAHAHVGTIASYKDSPVKVTSVPPSTFAKIGFHGSVVVNVGSFARKTRGAEKSTASFVDMETLE